MITPYQQLTNQIRKRVKSKKSKKSKKVKGLKQDKVL